MTTPSDLQHPQKGLHDTLNLEMHVHLIGQTSHSHGGFPSLKTHLHLVHEFLKNTVIGPSPVRELMWIESITVKCRWASCSSAARRECIHARVPIVAFIVASNTKGAAVLACIPADGNLALSGTDITQCAIELRQRGFQSHGAVSRQYRAGGRPRQPACAVFLIQLPVGS